MSNGIVNDIIDLMRWKIPGAEADEIDSLRQQNTTLAEQLATTLVRNQELKRKVSDLEAMLEEVREEHLRATEDMRNELTVVKQSWSFYYNAYCDLINKSKAQARA